MMNDADGIILQSVGGGGGNGGFTATGPSTANVAPSAFNVTLGGVGGTQNDAGNSMLTNTGMVLTAGDRAMGIIAQAIGGGGGNGNLTFSGALNSAQTALVTIGGSGSGNGGLASVANTGMIATGTMNGNTTTGFGADGILAQSIGGGGGNGSLFENVPAGNSAGSIGVAVGGTAGSAGTGGAVTISQSGAVQTLGAQAFGIAGQSIGGGGGNGAGGLNSSALLGTLQVAGERVLEGSRRVIELAPAAATYALNIAVGGVGSSGAGANVSIAHPVGDVVTAGDGADGIFEQSVGGGGGTGGGSRTATSNLVASLSLNVGGNGSSGNGGDIALTNQSNVTTFGGDAAGIFLQSVGGGGGTGGDGHTTLSPGAAAAAPDFVGGWSAAVGGSNGSSGDGGGINLNNGGNIATQGGGAYGIFAQSVGGGGGEAGNGAVGPNGTLTLGGSTGAFGNGGVITLANVGDIQTQGVGATGIFAQSVGGGGGVAGNVDQGVGKQTIGLIPSNASGGGGGNGGNISVWETGAITTFGAGSDGIFAQSVGGGGGLAGTSGNSGTTPITALLSQAGSIGNAGSAGSVSVTENGAIVTHGDRSDGIFAQSAGGTGTGGDVTVNVNGVVRAYGDSSDGVVAQSLGGSGGGNLAVTVAQNGAVMGGSGSAEGVRFINGASSTLTNNGYVSTANGVFGTAISGSSATSLIDNFGSVVGSVTLGGDATFNNHAASFFAPGSTVDLGTGTLTNAGTLSPGGQGLAFTTNLTGNLTQTTTGTLATDLDFASKSADKITVTGAANLGGIVGLNLLNVGSILPGKNSYTIVTANGGVTQAGMTIVAAPSAVAAFTLGYPDLNNVQINANVNFSPGGLTDNGVRFGNYIAGVQLAGSSTSLIPLLQGIVGSPDVASLQHLYTVVDPAGLASAEISMLNTNLQFANSLMSCRSGDGVRPDMREDECAWGRVGDLHLAQASSAQTVGFTEATEGLSTGFERAIGSAGNKHVYVGSAIAFDTGNLGSEGVSTMSGDRAQAGVDAKYDWRDGTILGASFTGGFANYNTYRYISVPNTTATGNDVMSDVAAHLRLSHAFGLPSASIAPYLDAGWTRLNVQAFTEVGAGPLDASLAGHSDTFYTLQPGFEFAGQFKSGVALVRPSLDFSVENFLGNAQADALATLQGAPPGVTPFVSGSQFDRTLYSLSPGLEVAVPHGLDLRFGAALQLGAHTHSSSFFLRLSQKVGTTPR
jgi:hypothetical protein